MEKKHSETKKVVTITEKQKAARAANLEKGRAKKREKLLTKGKQKEEEPTHDEYEVDDSEDEYEASSDEETFVISKQKPKKTKTMKEKPSSQNDSLRGEVEELKNMMLQL
ncbi:MAG TPA: hypothetical protein PLS50_06435, partial [Candidatus Dojkabacteria bacterium]|nr:hypothetical protein [Candidatus Dojkabacteria bacterium]